MSMLQQLKEKKKESGDGERGGGGVSSIEISTRIAGVRFRSANHPTMALPDNWKEFKPLSCTLPLQLDSETCSVAAVMLIVDV